jgi:hypothetical protein
LLAKAGMRLMHLNNVMHVGLWSWTDSAELRTAFRVFESHEAPIVYLDAPNVPIPERFGVYRGAPENRHEPLPAAVVEARYRHLRDEPWVIRDEMLKEMGRG